jgi:serine/threonine-protein kinase
MTRHLVLPLLALCLSLNVHGQIGDSLETKQEIEWKSMNGDGYEIQYPANWDIDKSGQMGMRFILLSEQASPQDKFRENVNLLTQNLTGLNIDMNAFVKISEDQVKAMFKGGKIYESKRVKNHGKSFHKLLYSGSQGSFVFKIQQYYWVENEKAYVLTFTCEAAAFDSYIETGDKIMNSFVLK